MEQQSAPRSECREYRVRCGPITTTCAENSTVWRQSLSHSRQERDRRYLLGTERSFPGVAKNHKTGQHRYPTGRDEKNTNRGVHDVVPYYPQGARRGLGDRRVAEAKLFDQKSTVSEQVGGALRICEWRDRVGLRILRVRTRGVYSIE